MSLHVLLQPRCEIATPLGTPVEPEVKMMYARSPSFGVKTMASAPAVKTMASAPARPLGLAEEGREPLSNVCSATLAEWSLPLRWSCRWRATVEPSCPAGGFFARPNASKTTLASMAPRICCTLATGWSSLIGTYARPEVATLSTATSCRQLLGTMTPTGARLDPASRAMSCAPISASECSSAKVRLPSEPHTAVLSAWVVASLANGEWINSSRSTRSGRDSSSWMLSCLEHVRIWHERGRAAPLGRARREAHEEVAIRLEHRANQALARRCPESPSCRKESCPSRRSTGDRGRRTGCRALSSPARGGSRQTT